MMTNQQLRAKLAQVKCPRCGEWRNRKIRPFAAEGALWHCMSCELVFNVSIPVMDK